MADKKVKNWLGISSIGLMLVLGPAIGFFAGHTLDRWAMTEPYFTLLFLGLGFAGGVLAAYREIKSGLKNNDDKPKEPSQK